MKHIQSLKNIVDVEASGLSIRGYPIEVGVVLEDGTRYEALIKPQADWTYWDKSAQKIHNIPREQLMYEGKSCFEVCDELNELCAGRVLYSDCWVLDNSWINQLFYCTGIQKQFRCEPMEYLLSDQSIDFYSSCKKFVESSTEGPKHRALVDAVVIQKSLFILENLKPTAPVAPASNTNFKLLDASPRMAV